MSQLIFVLSIFELPFYTGFTVNTEMIILINCVFNPTTAFKELSDDYFFRHSG